MFHVSARSPPPQLHQSESCPLLSVTSPSLAAVPLQRSSSPVVLRCGESASVTHGPTARCSTEDAQRNMLLHKLVRVHVQEFYLQLTSEKSPCFVRKSACSDALDHVFLGSLRYSAWNLYTPLSSLLRSRTIVDSSVISERSQICQPIVMQLRGGLSSLWTQHPRGVRRSRGKPAVCVTPAQIKLSSFTNLWSSFMSSQCKHSQSMVKTGFANEKCLKSNMWHVAVPLHCVCSLMNKPLDPFSKPSACQALRHGALQVACECRLPWIWRL